MRNASIKATPAAAHHRRLFCVGPVGLLDIVLLLTIIVVVVVFGLYLFNRWASRKAGAQMDAIEQMKQYTTIYVIDKQKIRSKDANLPKAVADNIPRAMRFMKMPFVKAKVGPQVTTLMCDPRVFKALPVKKSVKVAVAGIYIAEMPGMKSAAEMKAIEKKRKEAKKTEKKSAKK